MKKWILHYKHYNDKYEKKKKRGMDDNMVGVILLKRVPTFVRTTIAT